MPRAKKGEFLSAREAEVMFAIRDLRRELHLTQDEIADVVGVTPGTFSKWERGRISPGSAQCAELADIAMEDGLHELERVFRRKPMPPTAVVEEHFADAGFSSTLRLADMCKLVVVAALDLDESGEEGRTEDAISRTMWGYVNRLIERERTTGESPLLLSNEQQELWTLLKQEHGGEVAPPQRRKRTRRPR